MEKIMNWKASQSGSRPLLVSDESNTMSFPAFAPIVSDAFEHFKDLPAEERYGVGRSLIKQGSLVDSVCLLRGGLVKLVYGTPDGRETTLGLRSSGWCAGAVWVLTNRPSVYSVVAVTPCTVSVISAADFSLRLMQSSKLMRHFISTLCNESISQASSQAQIMGWPAEERLRRFMRERNTVHLRLKTMDPLPMLKQMELAQLLSITPEHLSRLMRKTPMARSFDGLDGTQQLSA
jgi:CRP-like cAMP-binding protein